MTDSYRYWNRGGYENVISTTITALKEIEKLTKDTEKLKSTKEKKEILPSEDDWKFILGFYILENSLRTDAAFAEIYKTVRNRGWTEEKNEKEKETLIDFFPKDENGETKEKPNENEKLRNYYNANYKLDKQYHDNLANLIREIIDPYQRAFYQIMFTMEEYCSVKLSDTNKKEGFYKLREIYRLFGGFEYDNAFEEAKKLLDWLNEIKQSN